MQGVVSGSSCRMTRRRARCRLLAPTTRTLLLLLLLLVRRR